MAPTISTLDYTCAFTERQKGRPMRLAILLFCSVAVFGQSSAPPPEPKADPQVGSPRPETPSKDFGLGTGAHERSVGGVGILSDTQGVDFGPYIKSMMDKVKNQWYKLIPSSAEYKKGKLAIEFAIARDGTLADMRLIATSGDVALDRPAWGAITQSGPFPPLPSNFKGPYLAVRARFSYNPKKGDLH